MVYILSYIEEYISFKSKIIFLFQLQWLFLYYDPQALGFQAHQTFLFPSAEVNIT